MMIGHWEGGQKVVTDGRTDDASVQVYICAESQIKNNVVGTHMMSISARKQKCCRGCDKLPFRCIKMLQYPVYFVEKRYLEVCSLMSVLTKTNAIYQNGHDFGRPQYSVAIVISLTGHIKHAKEPYHIYLNLRTVRIMC